MLTKDAVVVVTGAAGGIVPAIVGDLAAASGGAFHLLDLTPAPGANDADILRFADDRDGLKRELIERMPRLASVRRRSWSKRSWRRIERLHAAQHGSTRCAVPAATRTTTASISTRPR